MIDRQKDRQIDRQTDTHSHTHTLSRIHTHTDTILYNYKFCLDSSLDSWIKTISISFINQYYKVIGCLFVCLKPISTFWYTCIPIYIALQDIWFCFCRFLVIIYLPGVFFWFLDYWYQDFITSIWIKRKFRFLNWITSLIN